MLYHRFLSLSIDGEVLVHLYIRRRPEYQSHDQADANLSYNLIFALQSLLVALEYLDEVVHSTEKAEPYGGDDHQDQIDVAQTSE